MTAKSPVPIDLRPASAAPAPLYWLTLRADITPAVPSLRVRVSATGQEILLEAGVRTLVTAENAHPFLTDPSLQARIAVELVDSPSPLPAVPAQE